MVKALDLFIQWHHIDCQDKLVVILGRSYLVGCPTRTLFQLKGATVHLCDEYTPNIAFLLSHADIIVFGTGKQIDVPRDTLKVGCVVFDIGIRMKETPEGLRVTGDVDMETVDSPDHRPRGTHHAGAGRHRSGDRGVHAGQPHAGFRTDAADSRPRA